MSSTRTVAGVEYRLIDAATADVDELFEFNKTYGSSPFNFIPDAPVLEHLSKVTTGDTLVWGAFWEGDLVGMITGERGGGYWAQTGPGAERACFIHEFVVKPGMRGKRIGVNLTALSVDPELGVFGVADDIDEMYTTVHVDNVASRMAFVKGGCVSLGGFLACVCVCVCVCDRCDRCGRCGRYSSPCLLCFSCSMYMVC
jgi:hypothetical protein